MSPEKYQETEIKVISYVNEMGIQEILLPVLKPPGCFSELDEQGKPIRKTEDFRMTILLGLPGFRIRQIDEIRACMGLVIDYDLLIDITKNPAQWMVSFKDGEKRRNVKLSDGVVPGIARTNAVTLISAYQAAMVDRALDIERPRRNGTYKPKDNPGAQPAPSPEPAQAREAAEQASAELKTWTQEDEDLAQVIEVTRQTCQAEEAKELLSQVAIEEMSDRIKSLEQAGPQEQIIRNLSQDGIVITKNAKGAYQWEITARASDMAEAIDKALRADKRLRDELGRGGGPDA